MFMWSFRLSKSRILICVLAIVLVATAAVTGIRIAGGRDSVDVDARQAEPVLGANASVKTNDQRISFLQSFGWEVAEEPAEIMEVIIPKEFDEVYVAYNDMQQTQGYDLVKYAGKRCKRYSYVVTNYPEGGEEVRANILVYNDKVIGGDVCTLDVGGFMHGFSKTV